VANAVTVGSLTIPAMIRVGYKREFAGAVEAAASTGGQITPPVLGAAAFLMIEFLAVPYQTIITRPSCRPSCTSSACSCRCTSRPSATACAA
jgi:TRAP-type uncharacterized transport system fused permease subunit